MKSRQRPLWQLLLLALLSLSLLFSPTAYAQSGDIEELLQRADSEGNVESLLELIEELRHNKLSINEADADALRQLPWLTPSDVHAILVRRAKKGGFHTMEELQAVIGESKAASIAPFIVIEKPPALAKKGEMPPFSGSFITRYFTETTAPEGVRSGAYGGGNAKSYNRLQLSTPHLTASLVRESDIGEPEMLDFTSFTLHLHDLDLFKSAVIGNYSLNFGQGLLIGQSRYFSKGSDPSGSVRLPSKQLTPFTSSAEYGFLQGAAATLKLDPFELTEFYSFSPVDARINSLGVITSFDESGYHRTPLELARKDNVTQTVAGARLLYDFHSPELSGRVGGTLIYFRYSEPLQLLEPDIATTARASSALSSIETNLSIGKLSVFGEAALSENPGATSWIAASEYELSKGVTMVAALRNYGVGFYSPFAGAFAERGTGASNEHGRYVGIKATFTERFTAGAYYDHFTFPSLSGDEHYPFPSRGHDTRGEASWKATPSMSWTLQLQDKLKEEARLQYPSGITAPSAERVWTALPIASKRARLDCDLGPFSRVKLRSRGEVKRVVERFLAGDQTLYGWLAYQQLSWEGARSAVKGRVTVFNTDAYDAAIYASEDDLPLTSSLGVYDGRGKSVSLLLLWQTMKQMKLALRYETTWYSDRSSYGSGNDQRMSSSPGSLNLGCYLSF
ncbi:MAG: helix-hairpin-helix domain-containing protein [Chlorobiaceae bacterium]